MGEVALEADDFDVAFFPDDDGLVACLHKFVEFLVRDFDERAGGIGDVISCFFPAIAIVI